MMYCNSRLIPRAPQMAIWIRAYDGKRYDHSLLSNQQPVHGSMTKDGTPIWIQHEGKRLRVQELLGGWAVYDELGHQGACGSGWTVRMDDGSTWVLLRDLLRGGWYGEPVDPELAA
jgi:hypothetical protein